MPTYEFECRGCGREFSQVQSMAEHARGGQRCPHCGSAEVAQKFSLFTAKTSRKS